MLNSGLRRFSANASDFYAKRIKRDVFVWSAVESPEALFGYPLGTRYNRALADSILAFATSQACVSAYAFASYGAIIP